MTRPTLRVVAGLITDDLDRVLAQQRTSPPQFAGLWEFPGGKIEPGETAQAALARELEEELGLRLVESDPWMRLLHDYAGSGNMRSNFAEPESTWPRIFLDVRRVTHFSGQPTGKELQHIEWLTVNELTERRWLEANRPIIDALIRSHSVRVDKMDMTHSRT